jgi:hypothetical protein
MMMINSAEQPITTNNQPPTEGNSDAESDADEDEYHEETPDKDVYHPDTMVPSV